MTVARPSSQSAARREWRWLVRAGLLPALTLTALAFGQGALAPAAGQTPPASGTVSGYVFHDLDRDGVRDEGEPGLERLVQLVQGGVLVKEDESGVDGSYSMTGVLAGDYQLVTEFDGGVSFCVDFFVPNFDPLSAGGCWLIIDQPWHPTTPESYAVSVPAPEQIQRDFGATPFDQSVLVGRAILEGAYAPPGTVIEALADGEVCGTTTMPAGPFPGGTYRIVIFGAGERTGCPSDGEPVALRVGGVGALELPEYTPQIRQTGPSAFMYNPIAMPNHAWYWMQEAPAALPPAGTNVRAVVDGTVCGETTLETQSGLGIPVGTGFHRLVVPSDSLVPGCGHPGATVEFRFGDTEATTSIAWQPGVHRLPLLNPLPQLLPTPTPSPGLAVTPSPATLPQAGGEPGGAGGSRDWVDVGMVLAIIAAALICLGGFRPIRLIFRRIASL